MGSIRDAHHPHGEALHLLGLRAHLEEQQVESGVRVFGDARLKRLGRRLGWRARAGSRRGGSRRLDPLPQPEGDQRAAFTWLHTCEITTEPSPTDDATRLTDPARTSPTAKMPGHEVA